MSQDKNNDVSNIVMSQDKNNDVSNIVMSRDKNNHVSNIVMSRDKNNHVSIECLEILFYQTHCDTNDNICLDLHNYHYSIFIYKYR